MKRLKGFTLAEVLITLGIIGVVAALTIPNLIAHYQKVVLETAYKKGVSVLANAMQLEMAKNNTPGDLQSTPLNKCYETTEETEKLNCFAEESKKLFAVTLDAYDQNFAELMAPLEYSPITTSNIFTPPAFAMPAFEETAWSTPRTNWVFMTSDGIVYGFMEKAIDINSQMQGFYILMDVNGAKRPNKAGEDLFKLAVNRQGKVTDMSCKLYAVESCTSEDYQRAFRLDEIYPEY